MFRKGNKVFVKYIDESFYLVQVNRKSGDMYDIVFDNGQVEQCHARNLYKEKPSEKPLNTINKHKKYIKKLENKKVNFGKFKDENVTYKQLLHEKKDYCKAIVKGFYTVPSDFKTFCCDHLIY